MHLRSFRPADLQTLYEIDQACFPPGISYCREEIARFIAKRGSRTWVAEAEDEIVGFLTADRHPVMLLGHVITVDVVEGWRRRGVGSALMDAAEEWARQQGFVAVSLETGENNRAAQAFYEARGYSRYEKLERYYANGEAAWIMVKWLKEGQRAQPRAAPPKPKAEG
jgi:ribosomal-protein-alanine N-acetyltransferase